MLSLCWAYSRPLLSYVGRTPQAKAVGKHCPRFRQTIKAPSVRADVISPVCVAEVSIQCDQDIELNMAAEETEGH